jgi:azurin
MGHNFVLLTKGTDIAKFATAAMNAKATEYIPSKGVIAHTKLIGGGESTTIKFTVSAKGTYDFICSFPGHYAMMKGKFIVE